MALTSAMLTGFTGITSNQTMVEVTGDNIANLNTTAFKGQRANFETLLYQTVTPGEGPNPPSGGSLPTQLGRGSTVGSIQRDFGQGAIEGTGLPSDVAMNGRGFFVIQTQAGDQRFTRDGAFQLDATNTLVTQRGDGVRGYGVGADGTIDRSTLTDLVIPLGSVSQAVATSTVVMDGRLDGGDVLASSGQVVTSGALNTSNGPATGNTALTDLVDSDGAGLFSAGDQVAIRATKGGGRLPASVFTVGETGSTVDDLAAYIETVTAIQTDPAIDPSAGVTLQTDPTSGETAMVVTSNAGAVNAVDFDNSGIVNETMGRTVMTFSQTAQAVGEGATTSFIVHDSLGNAVTARLRFAVESRDANGSTWRFLAESADDTDLSPIVGSGTVTFDANGQFVSADGTQLSVDRAGVGATTPLAFDLDLTGLSGLASADGASEVQMVSQDGTAEGVLIEYAVDEQGRITGKFTNQQEQVLGQLAVATFANDLGLLAGSGNLFAPGPDSGDAAIAVAGEGAAGTVVPGSLEQSNVELVRQFVDLISASTGISASSRVVRTTDNLLQELLLLAR